MGFWNGKSQEEDRVDRAHDAGQKDGSEGESKNWFYGKTWESEAVSTAYEKGFENGRDNQPKE